MKSIRTVLFVLILFLLVGKVAIPAFAVTPIIPEPTTETIKPIQKVEYLLAYPGILPDHPLYKLKALRDAILEFIISDPLKKTEFYILQADKRLGMGMALINEQKSQLAETTVSKGTKYLIKAVDQIALYAKNGTPTPGYLVDRITKSLQKQEEVITELITKAQDSDKTGLIASLDIVKKLLDDLTKINK